jgi:hypothetical protein
MSQINFLRRLPLLLLPSLVALQLAEAKPRRVDCPVVVDRQTGKFSRSRAKYHCYQRSGLATQAGYETFRFDDSYALCSSTPSPTPSGTPTFGGGGEFSLSGPGQKESVVFSAPNGGTISYSFPGGGEFEIRLMNASSGKRLSDLLETTQAAQGNLPFSNPGVPVYVKVEGPGSWSVSIDLD